MFDIESVYFWRAVDDNAEEIAALRQAKHWFDELHVQELEGRGNNN